MEKKLKGPALCFIVSFTCGIASTDATGCAYSGPPNIKLFLPHDKHCNLFYRLDKCPDGLYFNSKTQLCDWPNNTDCEGIDKWRHATNQGWPHTIVGGSAGPVIPVTSPEDQNPVVATTFPTNMAHGPGGGAITNAGANVTHEEGSTIREPHTNPNEGMISDSRSRNDTWMPEGEFVGGKCLSSKRCPPIDPLDSTIFLPHRTDCNFFCGCKKGKGLLYSCPEGLHFNSKLNKCDLPSHAECLRTGGTTDVEKGPDGPHPPNNIPMDQMGGSAFKFVGGKCPTTERCPAIDPLDVKIYIRHSTECNLFCGCKEGKPLLYRCSEGLHFNPNLSKCDKPNRAGCTGNKNTNSLPDPHEPETIIPSDTISSEEEFVGGACSSKIRCPKIGPLGSTLFIPHSTECNIFCGCREGKALLYRCTKGLHFSPKLRKCVLSSSAGCTYGKDKSESGREEVTSRGNCPTAEICPQTNPLDRIIFLPHLTNCKFFCRCKDGVAILHTCAQGLLFNPVSQFCEQLSKAGCKFGIGNETASVNNPGSVDGTVGKPENEVGSENAATTVNSKNGTESRVLKDSKVCPAVGKCPDFYSISNGKRLPHQNNCSLYCECIQGEPKLRECQKGYHYNAALERCDRPNRAGCQGDCTKLYRKEGNIWEPSTCVRDLSRVGDMCNITCAKGYELRGSSSILCTQEGWNGTGGLNMLPKCEAPEELGINLVDKIAEAVNKSDKDLLFLVDESVSIKREEFAKEISFIKAIVSAFPLSDKRSAGVITFSGTAAVDVKISHKDTCQFLSATDRIAYSGGSTDILKALQIAIQEIHENSAHMETLIFLITDGISETDPTPPADQLKREGSILFIVGVGRYERKQLEPIASIGHDGAPLFYGISNFNAFNKIAEYLNTVYGYGANLNCK